MPDSLETIHSSEIVYLFNTISYHAGPNIKIDCDMGQAI